MNYYERFEDQQNKLANVLEANGLLHTFRADTYPMSLTITQNTTPDAQMALFDMNDEKVSSRDAILRLVFELDALKINTSSRLVISDALMNKIKNIGKKMHHEFLHGYFAASVTHRTPDDLPQQSEDMPPVEPTDEFEDGAGALLGDTETMTEAYDDDGDDMPEEIESDAAVEAPPAPSGDFSGFFDDDQPSDGAAE